MRLTTIILLACLMQVSAATFAQRITLNQRNAPLKQVLKEIRQQSGYDIYYDNNLIPSGQKVTIKVEGVTVEEALNSAFSGLDLTFQIEDKLISITKKKTGFLDNIKAAFAVIDVHGRVVDEKGQPLPGATVKLKDESQVTNTDKDGMFYFKRINEKSVIVISSIGYLTRELNATADLGTIILEISNSKLDEVQIIAYGESSQRLNIGNVSVVNAKTIADQPVSNPLLALEGQVAGLYITQTSGVSGSGVSVQIRGQNSIQNGNDPLYIIDNVPYSSQLLPNLGGAIFGFPGGNSQAGSPFSFLNPSDIESISVLKDADATAIYGSRGANGVILITTKKGKAGATKVDINVQSGYAKNARKADLLNTQQYLEMRNEALKNDGITPSLDNGDYDLLLWDTKRYTDWQKLLTGGTAHYTDAQGTVSGGNEYTQFLIGGGYHRETTVFPGNFADQNGSLHFALNNKSQNQKFSIALTGNYMIDDNHLPNFDPTSGSLTLAPNAPSLYNGDGSLNWAPNSSGISTFQNPLAATLRTYNNKTNNLVANLTLSYELLRGLYLKSSFGYTNLQSNELTTQPLTSIEPENRPTAQRAAVYGTNNIHSYVIEPQLNYKKVFGWGKIDGLLGSTIQKNNGNAQTLLGLGYNSDIAFEDQGSASKLSSSGSTQYIYRYNALFGRASYNLNDEFLVNFNVRRDGSSRFGAANRFHNFGSVGLGWIFSKEKFIQTYLPFLSFGKLRATYGTTGNDQIGNYQYLSAYGPKFAGVPYQGVAALITYSPANPYLQWELTKKFEIGLETGLFNDRIFLNASFNRNRSSNQLVSYPLPMITGYGAITKNFPATLQNTSWEFTINTINIKTKAFSWSSNFNLTLPKNKLVAFPGLESSSYASALIVGQPISIIKAFHFTGVDPATGLYQFASKTDPSNPSFTDDLTQIINPTHSYYGGFQNSLVYKTFRLDFLFQFVKQIGPNVTYTQSFIPGSFNNGFGNTYTSQLLRWQKPGDITNVQQFNSDGRVGDQAFYMSASDAAYTDASYIRLKTLAVSWELPNHWVKSLNMRNIRLVIQGQNLLTFTKYKGLDPETLNTNLPPLRVITTGLQLGFN